MTDDRKEMERALKEIFIPELRLKGFKGSMPHFRRILSNRVDYLSFQFYSAGGSFVVEIAKAAGDGKPKGFGNNLPIEKLNVSYFADRLRLGSKPDKDILDHWFQFGRASFEEIKPIKSQEYYNSIAESVLSFFNNQAETWWQK
jgi:hypothetical protein